MCHRKAQIFAVEEGGYAQSCGLSAGDLLEAVDGQPLQSTPTETPQMYSPTLLFTRYIFINMETRAWSNQVSS